MAITGEQYRAGGSALSSGYSLLTKDYYAQAEFNRSIGQYNESLLLRQSQDHLRDAQIYERESQGFLQNLVSQMTGAEATTESQISSSGVAMSGSALELMAEQAGRLHQDYQRAEYETQKGIYKHTKASQDAEYQSRVENWKTAMQYKQDKANAQSQKMGDIMNVGMGLALMG